MICKNCSAQNADSSKFCENCGSPLKENVNGNNAVENSKAAEACTVEGFGNTSVKEQASFGGNSDTVADTNFENGNGQNAQSNANSSYTQNQASLNENQGFNGQQSFGGQQDFGKSQPTIPVPPVENPQDDGKGFAIASLVCSILSMFCCGIFMAPLGIIFALIAKSKGSKSGMATAGLIVGIVAIIIMVLSFIASIAAMSTSDFYSVMIK